MKTLLRSVGVATEPRSHQFLAAVARLVAAGGGVGGGCCDWDGGGPAGRWARARTFLRTAAILPGPQILKLIYFQSRSLLLIYF